MRGQARGRHRAKSGCMYDSSQRKLRPINFATPFLPRLEILC